METNIPQETPHQQIPKPPLKDSWRSRNQNKMAFWAFVFIGTAYIMNSVYNPIPDDRSKAKTTTTGVKAQQSARDSVFEAGALVGVFTGMSAYNGGENHATAEELDSAGRRLTADMKFDQPKASRQDWIDGYKAGYEIGWKNAKKQ
jgi:hypothetical protein